MKITIISMIPVGRRAERGRPAGKSPLVLHVTCVPVPGCILMFHHHRYPPFDFVRQKSDENSKGRLCYCECPLLAPHSLG